MFRLVYGVVVLSSTIWATADASRLGARKGATGGGFLDMGPVGWFFACFFLWIVAFPCYLFHRRRLVAAHRTTYSPLASPSYMPSSYPPQSQAGPWLNGYQQPVVAPSWPPPPQPSQPGRWLNGYQPPPEPSWPPPGQAGWSHSQVAGNCHTCGIPVGGTVCTRCGTPTS
jgi:hypothetical protein